MAEKKVPQEPCIFCGHNPCDCGQPTSRKRGLADRHPKARREEGDDGTAGSDAGSR